MADEIGKFSSPAALIILAITLATIAGAWAFQLIGGYIPCPLCLQQRWPYYAVIPLAFILFMFSRTGGAMGLVRVGLVICGLIMLVSAGMGGHHSGVEWGWWAGPTECSGGAGLSKDSVLPDLSNMTIVRCDEVQWRFMGLSFAGWNFVISLFTAFVAFRGARRLLQP
ncbi:MAG: disulfide bond formation protein B [Alphaproteobacteria bacterium]|nr:disulfide bond formation protein B [Alphaproteobacteria bacterium]